MPRLYRAQPDSSSYAEPRVLVRSFPGPGRLREGVAFYRALTGAVPDMDLELPESGLHLVAVGGFLVVELDPYRHELAAATDATVVVPHLTDALSRATDAGAEVVQPRWESPVGAGVRLQHPDGMLVEYVEHRPSEHDVPDLPEWLRE